MIIGLTGLARCGKDTAAQYLKDKYGFEVLVFSDVLRQEAKKRKMKPTKMNLSALGDELRKKGGQGIVAKKIVEKIEEEKDYVLSGFRSPEEADYVRNETLDFHLIEVYADKDTRFKRRDETDPQTEEEFFARDKGDIINKGMDKVLKMTDYRVPNKGTKKDLEKEVDKLMKKLGVKK